eukprot:s828_g6.t1
MALRHPKVAFFLPILQLALHKRAICLRLPAVKVTYKRRWGGSALVLYDDRTSDVTVVQPNEDGSYWRKVVRNKVHRMKEMRRMKAAERWAKKEKQLDKVRVLSSYGPYKTSSSKVMDLSTRAIDPKVPAAFRS